MPGVTGPMVDLSTITPVRAGNVLVVDVLGLSITPALRAFGFSTAVENPAANVFNDSGWEG